MKALTGPPRWAEVILEPLLAPKDRKTVTDDLREEYAEAVLPQKGRINADLWYLRQAATLAPRCIIGHGGVRAMLLLVSLLSLTCVCWLAIMEARLRHPGYMLRLGMDVSIAFVPLATIVVLFLHLGMRVERWLWMGAIALIGIAALATLHNAHSFHFEGFVLLVSVTLTLQGGILMLLSLGKEANGSRPTARETGGTK